MYATLNSKYEKKKRKNAAKSIESVVECQFSFSWVYTSFSIDGQSMDDGVSSVLYILYILYWYCFAHNLLHITTCGFDGFSAAVHQNSSFVVLHLWHSWYHQNDGKLNHGCNNEQKGN